ATPLSERVPRDVVDLLLMEDVLPTELDVKRGRHATLKAVLSALAARADYDTWKNARPSVATIQQTTAILSDRTVQEAIKTPECAGLIIHRGYGFRGERNWDLNRDLILAHAQHGLQVMRERQEPRGARPHTPPADI